MKKKSFFSCLIALFALVGFMSLRPMPVSAQNDQFLCLQVMIPDNPNQFEAIVNGLPSDQKTVIGNSDGIDQKYVGQVKSTTHCKVKAYDLFNGSVSGMLEWYKRQPFYVYLDNFLVRRENKATRMNVLLAFEETGIVAYYSDGSIERRLGLAGQQAAKISQVEVSGNYPFLQGSLSLHNYVVSSWMDANWIREEGKFKDEVPLVN